MIDLLHDEVRKDLHPVRGASEHNISNVAEHLRQVMSVGPKAEVIEEVLLHRGYVRV